MTFRRLLLGAVAATSPPPPPPPAPVPDLVGHASQEATATSVTMPYTVPSLGGRTGALLVAHHGVNHPFSSGYACAFAGTFGSLPMTKLAEAEVENNVPGWTRFTVLWILHGVTAGQSGNIVASHPTSVSSGTGTLVRAWTLRGALAAAPASTAINATPAASFLTAPFPQSAPVANCLGLCAASVQSTGQPPDFATQGGFAHLSPVSINTVWNGHHPAAIKTMDLGESGVPGFSWNTFGGQRDCALAAVLLRPAPTA